MELSRSVRALLIGLLVAAIGGAVVGPEGGLGIVVLAVASVCVTIGVIGLGVRFGLADHADALNPKPAPVPQGRPWRDQPPA